MVWLIILAFILCGLFDDPICYCCCMQDGSSALIAAAYEGHADVVTCLLSAGADVNVKNEVRDGWYHVLLILAVFGFVAGFVKLSC